MRVFMTITFFDKDKKQILDYDKKSEKIFFRFELKRVEKEVDNFEDCPTLKDEYKEVISSSEIKFMDDSTYFFHFAGNSWKFNTKTEGVIMENQIIQI